MADNIVHLQHTPQTPTEVLYQQTVDSLRKELATTREIARELAAALLEDHGEGGADNGCEHCLLLAKARAAGLLSPADDTLRA